MKYILLSSLTLMFLNSCSNQNQLEIPDYKSLPKGTIDSTYSSMINDIVYKSIDILPEPIGGIQVIQNKLEYPSAAKSAQLSATVIIEVLITKTGEIPMRPIRDKAH